MDRNADLQSLILQVLERYNRFNQPTVDLSAGADTLLFGPGGALDSMALVTLVVEVEEEVELQYGVQLVLADEKAVSRKLSPFLSIRRFAAYIDELLPS